MLSDRFRKEIICRKDIFICKSRVGKSFVFIVEPICIYSGMRFSFKYFSAVLLNVYESEKGHFLR